ncbi:hypothetical protein QQP08_005504 [Theobroma cacao]|uniref:Secreted protein n=1 Tax=Theobroma cacao TaxID=3641 RepID=A0A061FNW2_THECC|nr:Uncharacterized protein TCM_043252 [Theobroma cacao]WRX13017.1 hypothetical protein QQP08_005504 [Theobroma cacao]
MPTTLFFMFLLYFFLLLSPPPVMIGMNSMAIVGGATRPLVSKSPGLVTFKPETGTKHGFHSQDVKNCLPKGFHRTSAPSRYINDHTFGSTMCSTTSDISTRP